MIILKSHRANQLPGVKGMYVRRLVNVIIILKSHRENQLPGVKFVFNYLKLV